MYIIIIQVLCTRYKVYGYTIIYSTSVLHIVLVYGRVQRTMYPPGRGLPTPCAVQLYRYIVLYMYMYI